MKTYLDRYFSYAPDTDAYVRSLSPVSVPTPGAKLIAYYLPQFHPLEENEKIWGKGYTEWTGFTRAVPQFVGHQQPQLPTELGFYDLRVPEVQERQAAMAKAAGLSAFCFYFYWFSGKTVMELPIRNFAGNKNIDFEFCLCWANHDWTPPGRKHEVLIPQRYDAADDIAFISHIAEYLSNDRYLRVDGNPLLLVWGASRLPSAKETVRRWRGWCDRNGIGPIHICAVQFHERADPAVYGMDSATHFPPGDTHWHESAIARYREPIELLNQSYAGSLFDYRDFVTRGRNFAAPNYRLFRAVFPAWDNEARRPGSGFTLVGSDPATYLEYLETTLDQTVRTDAAHDKLVFINAWNEWAEGAHLEPDHRFGFGYLEATKMACLRVALKHHAAADEPKRLAIIVHLTDPERFDQDLARLRTFEVEHDMFVTVPSRLHAALDRHASENDLALTVVPVESQVDDLVSFLKALYSLDLSRYGRIVKLPAPASCRTSPADAHLVDVNWLTEASRALDRAGDIGIIRPSDHIPLAAAVSEKAAAVARRLCRRMGAANINDATGSLGLGPAFLARTAALLPFVTLGGAIKELEREQHPGDEVAFRGALERVICHSARAASLNVTVLDPAAEAILPRAKAAE